MSLTSLQPHVGDGPRAKAITFEIEQMMIADPNNKLKNEREWRERLMQARYDDWLEARGKAERT